MLRGGRRSHHALSLLLTKFVTLAASLRPTSPLPPPSGLPLVGRFTFAALIRNASLQKQLDREQVVTKKAQEQCSKVQRLPPFKRGASPSVYPHRSMNQPVAVRRSTTEKIEDNFVFPYFVSLLGTSTKERGSWLFYSSVLLFLFHLLATRTSWSGEPTGTRRFIWVKSHRYEKTTFAWCYNFFMRATATR